MRALVAVVCFILFAGFMPHKNSGSFIVEPSGGALADLVASMASGEWKLIPGSDFNDVRLTEAEHDAIVAANPGSISFWAGGSAKVLTAWSSAAFDPVQNRWFFHGGGHADYGGNEVYQYDFDTLQWTRLIEPSPLGTVQIDGTYVPNDGPMSSHTYNGLFWNPATQTMWLSFGQGFQEGVADVKPDYKAVWQFDPDSLSWGTGHPITTGDHLRPAWTYLPGTQDMLVMWHPNALSGRAAAFYDTSGNETPANSGNLLPDVWSTPPALLRIPDDASPSIAGRIFSMSPLEFQEYSISGSTISEVGAVGTLPDAIGNEGELGYAWRPSDELFYIWMGGRETASWNPSNGVWTDIPNVGSVTAPLYDNSRIFGKWVYLEDHDVFAGISAVEQGGIWLWKP